MRDELPPTLTRSRLPVVGTVGDSTWTAYHDDRGNRFEHERFFDGSEQWYREQVRS